MGVEAGMSVYTGADTFTGERERRDYHPFAATGLRYRERFTCRRSKGNQETSGGSLSGGSKEGDRARGEKVEGAIAKPRLQTTDWQDKRKERTNFFSVMRSVVVGMPHQGVPVRRTGERCAFLASSRVHGGG